MSLKGSPEVNSRDHREWGRGVSRGRSVETIVVVWGGERVGREGEI